VPCAPACLPAGCRICFRSFLANGLTGVHVAGTDPGTARLMTAARRKDCPVRLYAMLREGHVGRAVELKKAMAADEWGARYGAIKRFYGNSLSGQTAWLYEPYANQADYQGLEARQRHPKLREAPVSSCRWRRHKKNRLPAGSDPSMLC
jgi:predicted amidohydrolase YtcJ